MTQANSKVFLDSEQYGGNDGLTKREFFAAMAMGGIVEAGNVPDKTDAEWCVSYADNLIEALNK